jgi:hypothetical protein
VSKTNTLENGILGLLFNGTAIADLAENDTTSPLTSLYVSLHTADPGEAGSQTTNEATYGAYARQAVSRSGSGWTVSGNSVSPTANIDFPEATSGSETITHVGIGTLASGAGVLLWKGALSSSIAVSTGVIPRIGTGSTITED